MANRLLFSESTEERARLGNRLRQARKYLGLRQNDVSEYLNIPRSALSEIEGGQRRLDALELTRLAKLYKQPLGYFTGEDASTTDLPADVAYLARKVAGLSEQDRAELSRFAEFLSTHSKTKEE